MLNKPIDNGFHTSYQI